MRASLATTLLCLCLSTADAAPAAADDYVGGYASATSVGAGDTLGVHVSSTCPSLTLRIYRFGPSPTRLLEVPDLVPTDAPVPDSAYAHGCGWPTLYTLTVPADWTSGMYEIQLVPPDSVPVAHVPFVVRGSPANPNPILILSAVNTAEAYNAFGGKSLYDFNSTEGERSPKVTFDRPYDSHGGLGQPHFELPLVRWFERSGFTADYATDVDLALDPAILAGRRLLLIMGHSEYWSASMFDAVESFVDTSGNVAFLSGNTCYYAVRYEDQGRTLVCYKSHDDPMFASQPESTTVRWRDPPLGRPECLLAGVAYPYCGGTASDSLLFVRQYGWITEGLEGEAGHRFGSQTVGYEYDTYFDGCSPPKVITLFQTPEPLEDCPQLQASIYYERQPAFGYGESGGGIFAAGTIQWSWGLDSTFAGPPDPRMQLLTSNLVRGLRQPLRVPADGSAVIQVTITEPGLPPEVPLTVQPAQVGLDETSYDESPLLDDGVWPDSLASDGIYTGEIPLPAGRRLPLLLTFRAAGERLCTHTDRDYFWLDDTARADSLYWRFVDTLSVCPHTLDVGAAGTGPGRLTGWPNPFRSSLQFSWDRAFEAKRLSVHDAQGRLVARIPLVAGATGARWNGRDTGGRDAGAGVYWARAEGARGVRVTRLVKLP